MLLRLRLVSVEQMDASVALMFCFSCGLPLRQILAVVCRLISGVLPWQQILHTGLETLSREMKRKRDNEKVWDIRRFDLSN